MNVAEGLRANHKDLLQSTRGLTSEQLVSENSFGRWSARDVLLHIAMWVGEVLKAVAVWKTKHDYDWDYAKDYLSYNDFWINSTKHLSVDQVLQMLNLHHFVLYGELSSISPETWTKRGIPGWLKEIAIDHSREHAAKLRAIVIE